MKEYGGYIELEDFQGGIFHDGAIQLNCGRGALEYLCKTKKIKKLYLPYFLCSSVTDLCEKIGVEYEFYHINNRFEPNFNEKLEANEWLYIVNFYGQLDNEYLQQWKLKYSHIIVDSAQSYFQKPEDGIDTIYTCRKFFGVADGAFLYTDTFLNQNLPVDESFNRMHFLLGRYERTANEFYNEYVSNNKLFAKEPVKQMSRLTCNLLRGINYDKVATIRQENFDILSEAFCNINELNLRSVYGAFMYPLLVKNGMEIRKLLQKEKIYIPTLWPNVLDECSMDSLEYHYAADTLPIPVDQRYGKEDMRYLVEVIKNVLSKRA